MAAIEQRMAKAVGLVPFLVRGLIIRRGWMVLFGLAVHMAGKNWFLDRMALLHDDMAGSSPDPSTRTGARP